MGPIEFIFSKISEIYNDFFKTPPEAEEKLQPPAEEPEKGAEIIKTKEKESEELKMTSITSPTPRTVWARTLVEFLNSTFNTNYKGFQQSTWKYNDWLEVWMVEFGKIKNGWLNKRLDGDETIHEIYVEHPLPQRHHSTRLAVSIEGEGSNRYFVILGVYKFCREESDSRTYVYHRIPHDVASKWIPEAFKYKKETVPPKKETVLKVGDRVVHKNYARNVGKLGTVIYADDIKIRIRFENGTEISFVLPDCLKYMIIIE